MDITRNKVWDPILTALFAILTTLAFGEIVTAGALMGLGFNVWLALPEWHIAIHVACYAATLYVAGNLVGPFIMLVICAPIIAAIGSSFLKGHVAIASMGRAWGVGRGEAKDVEAASAMLDAADRLLVDPGFLTAGWHNYAIIGTVLAVGYFVYWRRGFRSY